MVPVVDGPDPQRDSRHRSVNDLVVPKVNGDMVNAAPSRPEDQVARLPLADGDLSRCGVLTARVVGNVDSRGTVRGSYEARTVESIWPFGAPNIW